jgi:hypothetical protein
VFAGELAAVDAELIRRGLLYDLRDEGSEPKFQKREASRARPQLDGHPIIAVILDALAAAAARRGFLRRSRLGQRP